MILRTGGNFVITLSSSFGLPYSHHMAMATTAVQGWARLVARRRGWPGWAARRRRRRREEKNLIYYTRDFPN